MPHAEETRDTDATHNASRANPHATTAAQLGLGVLQSSSGTVAPASGTPATIFTVPASVNGLYLVSCGLNASDPANYSAVSIVSVDNAVLRATALQTAGLMTITVSGLNIRAQQNSGGSPPLSWTVLRIS